MDDTHTRDIEISPVTAAQLPELHALIESAYRGDSARAGWTHEADLLTGQRTDLGTLAALMDDPDEHILAAMQHGRMTGCIQLRRISDTIAYFGMFAVDPQQQGGGIGKHILNAAEQIAAHDLKASVMQLSVLPTRTELIAYYQRRGYALTGEIRPFPITLDPPLTLVVLEKSLVD
jgi:ribosomal protein S18 acetylase RimI-like enzyme